MTKEAWVGFRFPARSLTTKEIELFSPRCERCDLPAVIVELQQPLTKKLERQSLLSMPNNALKFFCSYHAPIDATEDQFEQTDWAFYERLRVQIQCPKYEHLRYACNCLRHQQKCFGRCEPLKHLTAGTPIKRVMEIVKRSHEIEERRKEKKEVVDDPHNR